MVTRVSRRMEYAGRFGRQQADQAIKKDLVRALVELVTNSDDSYRRLENQQISADGRILVEIHRRHRGSVLRVTDFAEGMDGYALDHAIGTYAGETSGFMGGEPVRGYFGRGVKDAILGLGEGTVTGIVNNEIHHAWLGIQNNEPFYRAQDPIRSGDTERPNSTSVEITVSRDDIRIPRFDNIRAQLSLHFALRDILVNSSRKVILSNLNAGGGRGLEFQLGYHFPQGQLLLQQILNVSSFDTFCEIEIHLADVPLDTPREQGYIAQAGLLVKSANAILDNTLFRFDGDINAQRFYGRVVCPYLDELLREDETILLATRDGLDRSHPFIRRLFELCEEVLTPLIEQERRRARREQTPVQNDELRAKLNDAVSRFNQIARSELADIDSSDTGEEPEPYVPESGYGFVPEYVTVLTARRRTLALRGLARITPEGSIVNVTSDNPNVSVVTPIVILEPREDHDWIVEARAVVEGIQVGAEAILAAECEGLTAEALVRVVARPDPPDPPDGPRLRRRRGLFNEIRFTDERNPRQRVRYDSQSKDVIVATNHASVRPYIHDSSGVGTDSAQGQVMLAELISEAVCGAIARHGIETGRFVAPVGGEAEATQVQQLRLQNQYSGLIHEVIVAQEFRA